MRKYLSNKLLFVTCFLMANLYSQVALSADGTDLGAPSSGFFAKFGKFMQQIVDFLEGPWGTFVAIVGLAAAATIWALGSRNDEGMGKTAKVIIAVLLILNIPALVIALKGA